jgi:CHASE2 domain-containing sensor protein
MQTDRRAILSLIALGRISPSEAERLLVAWNQGWETFWVCAATVVAILLAQFDIDQALPALAHLVQSLLSGRMFTLHHALMLLSHFFGGSL